MTQQAPDGACREPVVAHELHRLDRVIHRYLSRSIPQQITPEEMGIVTGGNGQILHYLDSHPDEHVYQRDIEKAFGVTRSTASRMLGLMEEKGLIERISEPGDKRLKRLITTEKSKAISKALHENFLRMDSRLMEGITSGEEATLLRIIGRMIANLEAAPGGANPENER